MGISMNVKPKFAKHFGEIGEAMKDAFMAYDKEVTISFVAKTTKVIRKSSQWSFMN